MASDEEDEELAALRFAALASRKSKQKSLVEDEDLRALKEAALKSLEKTLVTPFSIQRIGPSASIPHPSHLNPVQHAYSDSANFYSTQPHPQFGQYSQSPPNYQQVHLQDHHHYKRHSKKVLSTDTTATMFCITKDVTVGKTYPPPGTAATYVRDSFLGNHIRSQPPRTNNLIVINPMPIEDKTISCQAGGGGQTNNSSLPQNPTSAKPVLLRPQDRWSSGAADTRPRASGKFSRFNSSTSESEESDSDDEVRLLKKSSDNETDSDTERSLSDNEPKILPVSHRESGSSEESLSSQNVRINYSSSCNSGSEDNELSNCESTNQERCVDEKSNDDWDNIKAFTFRKVEESETEEEKLERREADRLLEETMDSQQVLKLSSEKDLPRWTTTNPSIMVTAGNAPMGSFDLAYKLVQHRARVKELNGNDVPWGLSSKLTNWRTGKEIDQKNSASRPSKQIQERQKRKLSENDLQKLEARKRKFESSPRFGSKEGKKTISLKGIVPRSKKRQGERHGIRSKSPVPKCYSKDLKRYEKKKASKHKHSSKENKKHKMTPNLGPHVKDKKDSCLGLRDQTVRKSLYSSGDSSDESKVVFAQISDIESEDEEGRSWRTKSNKIRLNSNKDQNKSVKNTQGNQHIQGFHCNLSQYSRNAHGKTRFEQLQKRLVFPEHRTDDVKFRKVDVMRDRGSDSDEPRMKSSVVLPKCSHPSQRSKEKPQRQKEECENMNSKLSKDSVHFPSYERFKPCVQKRLETADCRRNKQSRGCRKVTTDCGSYKTLSFQSGSIKHSNRKAKFDSSARSAFLSVTLHSDIDLPETETSQSHCAIHERLGPQPISSDSNVERTISKHRDREKKQTEWDNAENISMKNDLEEASKADDELEQRIQRIKEKNVAILKRQEEVRQDKERYG